MRIFLLFLLLLINIKPVSAESDVNTLHEAFPYFVNKENKTIYYAKYPRFLGIAFMADVSIREIGTNKIISSYSEEIVCGRIAKDFSPDGNNYELSILRDFFCVTTDRQGQPFFAFGMSRFNQNDYIRLGWYPRKTIKNGDYLEVPIFNYYYSDKELVHLKSSSEARFVKVNSSSVRINCSNNTIDKNNIPILNLEDKSTNPFSYLIESACQTNALLFANQEHSTYLLNNPNGIADIGTTENTNFSCLENATSETNGYVKPTGLSWGSIKEKCKENGGVDFYDKQTTSIGFCKSYEGVWDTKIKADKICSDNKKGEAESDSFISNYCESVSKMKCLQSKQEIEDIKKQKASDAQKSKIDKLKDECEKLGYKVDSSKFKQCVIELM